MIRGTTLFAAKAAALQGSNKPLAMVTGLPEPLTQHEALGDSARERDCFTGAHRLTPTADSLGLQIGKT